MNEKGALLDVFDCQTNTRLVAEGGWNAVKNLKQYMAGILS
jgi:hypothetical protein